MDPLEVLSRPAPLPDAVLRYGAHEDGLLDVHLPASTRPAPLVVLVHGDHDRQVPAESSRRLVERYSWIDCREPAGAEHFGLIDPLSVAWPTVRAAVLGDGGTLST